MASSIKKSSKTGEAKKIKVNDKKDIEKVLSSNKSTVVTGKKSTTAVRKKPVVRKISDNKEEIKEEKKTTSTTKKSTSKPKTTIKATKKVSARKETKITEKELENIKEHSEVAESKKEEIKEEQVLKPIEDDLEPIIDFKKIKEEKNEIIEESVIEKEETDEEVKLFDTNKISVVEEKEEPKEEIKEEIKEEKKKNNSKSKLTIPGNRKAAISLAKNKKTSKKKTLTPEKNVKSVIKNVEPKTEIPKIEVKKDEVQEIKSIKVEEVTNIKKKAKASSSGKPTVKKVQPKLDVTKGKRVKSVYDPKLNRWVVKEDKSKPKLTGKNNKKIPIDDNDYTYELETGGLKSKFFEEVNVERFNEAKRQKRKKYPKKILIALIVLAVLFGGAFIFYKKYKEKIKHDLNMYEKFQIGQEVKLKDGSVWNVTENSDGSKQSVSLLYSKLLDVNEDGQIDDNDKKQYSSGNVKYDVKDNTSIAYYLENELKPKLEEKVGKINSINMIDSKVFVRIRDHFKYGYEWQGENILTSNPVHNYFVATTHEKIYIVSRSGAYRLSNATDKHFVRFVIDIDKSLIQKEEPKQEEKKEETKKEEEKKTGQQ